MHVILQMYVINKYRKHIYIYIIALFTYPGHICENGSYARPQREFEQKPKAAHLKAIFDHSTRNVELDDMTFWVPLLRTLLFCLKLFKFPCFLQPSR